MSESERRLFAQVEESFHRLSELSAQERAEELEALREQAPALHGELAALFGDGTGEARGLVERERAIDEMASAPTSQDGIPAAGDRLGPYRLIRCIGEGGMGRVFEAEQLEPMRRKVAVKVLRQGFESSSVLTRFEAERQALAVMNHPNIARMLDAGASSAGHPWFAMELIGGMPITRWAQEKNLDLDARIELLLPVCDAIQHAHSKGVVHRDLKPSNILVFCGEQGQPVPTVIDFGIAKAIHSPLVERTFATRLGELVGTPEYMSPEQASLGAVDVDTRSDVYGLGLVLYELLVGELPLSAESLRGLAFDEICRRIREDETPRPSSRTSALETVRGPRSTSRRVRGELDNVVLKALAKDRDRRYGSAAALAEDLRRFLRHEAVEAAPPSWRYRGGKFIRRHRLPVALAGLAFAGLVTGLILAVYGLLEARRSATEAVEARGLAEAARAEAESALQTSEETTRYLTGLFKASDPREGAALDLKVGEVLERGTERIEQLEGQPSVQARLLEVLGDVNWSLGAYDRAEALLERALEVRRDRAPDAERQAAVLNRLGSLHRDRSAPKKAEQAHRQAVALLEGAGLEETAEMGNALNSLGIALSHQARFDEATAAMERSLALTERLEAAPSGNLASGLLNLAVTRHRAGDTAGALVDVRRSLALFEQILPAEHPNLAVVHSNLSTMAARLGHLGTALHHGRLALEIDRQALPEGHPNLAFDLIAISGVAWRLGRHDEARRADAETLDILKTTFGESSFHHVSHFARIELARAQQAGSPEAALPPIKTLLEMLMKGDAPQGLRRAAGVMRSQAALLRRSGRPEEALALIGRGRELADQLDREEIWPSFKVVSALALLDLGREEEAAEHLAAALVEDGCTFEAPCGLDAKNKRVLRAQWYALRDDLDAAFCTLELALEHPAWGAYTLEGPDLAALRADARWQALEEKLRARLELNLASAESGDAAAELPVPSAASSPSCRRASEAP